jgi:hypothetical protein
MALIPSISTQALANIETIFDEGTTYLVTKVESGYAKKSDRKKMEKKRSSLSLSAFNISFLYVVLVCKLIMKNV